MLKWKVVQNYKNLNSSKFIHSYNIIIFLDIREDILSVMTPERFSFFEYIIWIYAAYAYTK